MVEYAVKTPPHHATWQEFLDVWRVVDECDVFAQAWTFDHFYSLGGDMYPGSGDSLGPCLESWTMLAALAQATSRVRIGSMVNAMHFRHPALTAKMAATLDVISGGRLDLGLGAGWNLEESEAFGIELGTVKERLDRFEEGVEVIIRLLSQEVTDFEGRYYKITDARCEPKGIQRPHPPVLIGGGGRRRTLAIVAKWAQKWDGGFRSVPEWLEINEALVGHCEALGRNPSEIFRTVHIPWELGADPSRLREEASAFGEAGVDQVIFNMQGPPLTSEVEKLGAELSGR